MPRAANASRNARFPKGTRRTTVSFASQTAGTVALEVVGPDHAGKRSTRTRVYRVCSAASESATRVHRPPSPPAAAT